MERIIKKLKPVFLLISLSLVSMAIVFIVNETNIRPESGQAQARVLEEAEENSADFLISTVQDTSSPIEVEENEEEEVLAAATGGVFNCGGGYFTYIKSDSSCLRTATANVSFTKDVGASLIGNGLVSVDADIVLAEVTTPLELLSGVEVPDTNRKITSEELTLKPAGEQVSEKMANVLLPPGQQISSHKGWDADVPFSFDYITAFWDSLTTPSEENRIGVEKELENECFECDNAANVNPDKSNQISEFMYDSIYRYPNEKNLVTEADAMEACSSSSDTFTDWGQGYQSCRLNSTAEAIQRIKSITNWGAIFKTYVKCALLKRNDSDCIKAEDIVVKMDSPFGSDEDCLKDSACTNAFMARRANVALSPGSDLGGKHYYLTDCVAFVEGRVSEVKIKCAWDMSHLFKERKVNEFDDLPTVDSTPTDEEYNDFLVDKVKGTRGQDIDIQPGN